LLRPPDVVDFARENTDSALHSCFEWDDGEAAVQYRLWQARHLIRVHVCVLHDDVKPVRVFVSLKADREYDDGEGGYRLLTSVLSDGELREQLLAEALAELQVFEQKYRALQELVPVFEALADVRKKTRRRRATKGKARRKRAVAA